MYSSTKLYHRRRKDGRWDMLSLKLRNEANYTCQRCGFHNEHNKYVTVHHKYYIEDRDPWDYPTDAFQVLCNNCHQAINNMEEVPRHSNPNKDEMKEKVFILTRCFYRSFNCCDLKYNKYFNIRFYGRIIDCGYATGINQGDARFDYELILREVYTNDSSFTNRRSGTPREEGIFSGYMRLENYI